MFWRNIRVFDGCFCRISCTHFGFAALVLCFDFDLPSFSCILFRCGLLFHNICNLHSLACLLIGGCIMDVSRLPWTSHSPAQFPVFRPGNGHSDLFHPPSTSLECFSLRVVKHLWNLSISTRLARPSSSIPYAISNCLENLWAKSTQFSPAGFPLIALNLVFRNWFEIVIASSKHF